MKKTKIYLDTSIISFYHADDSPEKRDVTHKFFTEILNGEYDIFISYLVIQEINRTPDQILRDNFLNLVKSLSAEILTSNEEVEQISEKFIQEGVIPVKYSDDAVHLALALCNNIDYIFSWNFKHMVKLKTKKAVRLFAIKEGYKEIEIISPQEVTEDDD